MGKKNQAALIDAGSEVRATAVLLSLLQPTEGRPTQRRHSSLSVVARPDHGQTRSESALVSGILMFSITFSISLFSILILSPCIRLVGLVGRLGTVEVCLELWLNLNRSDSKIINEIILCR